MITADTITDRQIRVLRDGEEGLLDAALRDLCRIALQNGTPTRKRPVCQTCGWRKGGHDSWDGFRCECGLSALPYFRCDVCHGLGTTPYDIGSQPCSSCDGSGLIDPAQRVIARARCAEILNARDERAASATREAQDHDRVYPCRECPVMRSKAEGGTVFTVCDECWDRLHPKKVPADAEARR